LACIAAGKISAGAPAAAGYDQRCVARTDYETPPAPATAMAPGPDGADVTGAAHADLQGFPCGQAEIATNFGTFTTRPDRAAEPGSASALIRNP
jgi:hypothetical protein